VQSHETIQRWVLAVLLAWNYVLWRKAEAELTAWQKQQAEQEDTTSRSPRVTIRPADVIRQHREEHAIDWLREACQMAIKLGDGAGADALPLLIWGTQYLRVPNGGHHLPMCRPYRCSSFGRHRIGIMRLSTTMPATW